METIKKQKKIKKGLSIVQLEERYEMAMAGDGSARSCKDKEGRVVIVVEL